MVGRDEQPRGIGERLVLGEPARLGMAMRGEDRQIAHLLVEPARDRAGRGIGGEKAVLVEHDDLARKRVATIADLDRAGTQVFDRGAARGVAALPGAAAGP